MFKHLIVSSVALLFVSLSDAHANPKDEYGRDNFNQEFVTLSQIVNEFRQGLKLKANQKVYLTGGTAIAILEYLLYDEPIKMKDFDIAFVDKRISKVRAEALSNTLSRAGVSDLTQIVPKDWGKGWGFFHVHKKSGTLVDVSVFPRLTGITNDSGILNIERVQIVVEPGQSLIDVGALIKRHLGSSTAKVSKAYPIPGVLDPDKGFTSWRNKSPKIIKHAELREAPLIASMRIIRRFAKLDAELNDELRSTLSERFASHNVSYDKVRAVRHFSYFFDDINFAEEIKFAQEIGFFRHFLPSINKKIKELTVEELRTLFPIPKTMPPLSTEEFRVTRMQPLFDWLSASDRQPFMKRLAQFYPSIKQRSAPRLAAKSCRDIFYLPHFTAKN